MTQDLNERVELRTDRLLLRPFDFRDVDDVLAYASEPKFGRYLPVPQPYTARRRGRVRGGAGT